MKYTIEQQKQGTELMKTLIEKAWESATFKDQLIKNPVATIESVSGNTVTSDYKFVVEDQTNSSMIYLNIPRKIQIENLELTDEQLDVVSGGEIVLGLAIGAAFLTGMGVGVAICTAVN
ncbi:putative ribosomally synthesized peptide [Flavobacterium tiangeerense]|uniref:Ribosomally synthesized peptide n=1 Tax=Flavobacterium tiangeerense TaxID=459471 RepID=A0ABY3FNF1_9FLAO|nr:NHLP leader peptide family RiPP precursor [Flavobacterium tiangeerense]TWI03217.1 putative ribosomally synthesized peptide [Flavobacterium tiangeerense]